MEDILKAMEMNRYLQMTYFAKSVPTLDLRVQPDVTIVRSTIPDDTFNYVLAARFTSSNAAKRVAQVLDLYTNPQVPFSWWLGPLDTPKELDAILIAQNLSCKEENVGMYLDLSQFVPAADHSAVTGMIVFHANVAGIYYVATDPTQRKKGYGTVMMTYLVNRAKNRGYKLATLQASRAGKNLYERLGFKECCIFKEYALEGSIS